MPWGMDFNFGMPQEDFQYPVQESYQNNLAQGMASFFDGNNTPAMSAYQEFLGNAPSREDFNQPWWMKALAGLGGFATGWQSKDPTAGGKATQQMLDAPYLQALEKYKLEEPGLRNAATIEERGLGNQINYMKALQQAEYQRQQQLMMNNRYNDMDQQWRATLEATKSRDLANNENADASRKVLENHQKTMEGIAAQNANASSQNAATNLMEAENRRRKDLMGYELSDISGPGGGTFTPIGGSQDEGFMKFQLENALKADPMFQGAWTGDGWNLGAIDMTPEQYAKYQQYIQQFSGQR